MTKLMIATPVRAAELRTAQVSLGYAEFREQLARDVPSYVGAMTFSLDVVRARNRIVGMLLSHPEFADVTHVLWVDDDQWPEDIRIVPEMIAACRGVLAASYTNKKHPLRWVHQTVQNILMVGMGFTMVARTAIEEVARDADWYTDLPGGMRCPNVFGQLMLFNTLLSEDYSFCVRADNLDIPIELYAKAGIINHAGGHAWSARDMPGGVVEPEVIGVTRSGMKVHRSGL